MRWHTNHLAFYLRFERNGLDLYPLLRNVVAEGRVPDEDRFGSTHSINWVILTESSEHFAEYVPWYIKRDRPDLIETFNIPLDEYIRRCEVQQAAWNVVHAWIVNPEVTVDETVLAKELVQAGATEMELEYVKMLLQALDQGEISNEYGALIIHSVLTNTPRVIYGNVMNAGLIENLPSESCVEVPCLVDKNGIQPTKLATCPRSWLLDSNER